MSRLPLSGARRVPQLAVMALVSIAFGGCSADYDTRLSGDSFQQNPFASQRSEATGSVSHSTYNSARELPQYRRPATAPVVSAPLSYPVSQNVTGGGRGVASYTPPARNPIETTGSVAPRSAASREGGTRIIVGSADTLESISRHYNVPVSAILHANGYRGPRVLSPGQSLIIPRRMAAANNVMHSPSRPAEPRMAAAGSVHYVNSGDTLMNISRRNHISLSELARANNLPTTARLQIGTKIIVPHSGTTTTTAAAAEPAPVHTSPVAVARPPETKPATVVASTQPVQKARLATETKDIEQSQARLSPVKAEATNALPMFRWPARGRVIEAYGAKTNGKQNDGINIAVPEGTPIKAADDGVVAYAGNELKGYGNLILVRHTNGYVTAYAHASELLVKRGDTIKRGQVIAKSGQTGDVASPQLHFEIRKGSSPVDPLQFLSGA